MVTSSLQTGTRQWTTLLIKCELKQAVGTCAFAVYVCANEWALLFLSEPIAHFNFTSLLAFFLRLEDLGRDWPSIKT